MARKIKEGDVFVGDNGKRVDLFVVLKSEVSKRFLDIWCLTRGIGWERNDGRPVNQVEAGVTTKELSFNTAFDYEYDQYKFKRVKNTIPNSFFKSYKKEEE